MIMHSTASAVKTDIDAGFDPIPTRGSMAWGAVLAQILTPFIIRLPPQIRESLEGLNNAAFSLVLLPNDLRTAPDASKPLRRFHTIRGRFAPRVMSKNYHKTITSGKTFK